MTRQAVSSWETGKNQPDIETLESIAAVFDTDILMVLYGRSRLEESGEEKGAQRKRCVRNCLMWGAIALAGLVVHLMVKDKIMDWYYRFCYTVPVYLFALLVRPLCVFASAVAFMNGLCLIGDIRIRQNWIRRTVLGGPWPSFSCIWRQRFCVWYPWCRIWYPHFCLTRELCLGGSAARPLFFHLLFGS